MQHRAAVGVSLLFLFFLFSNRSEASRTFNGTNDSMSSVNVIDLSNTSSMSVSFWLLSDGPSDSIIAESSANYNTNAGAFLIDGGGRAANCAPSFYFGVQTSSGNSTERLRGFLLPSTGVWHHYLLVMNAAADTGWSAYVDGVAQTLNNCNNGTPANINFGKFQVNLMARNGASLFTPGQMAEFAVWTTALTSSDASNLASGALASTIQSFSLASYVQMCGATSPEPDQVVGTWKVTGTIGGTQPPGLHDCGVAPPPPPPPPAPKHSVALSWNATQSVAGYNAYRGTIKGGPYTKLNSSLIASASYTDLTVQSGATYFYVATAVDSSGLESAFSNEAQAVIPGTLGAPTNLIAVPQ